MKITRIYADDSGESHFEDEEIRLTDSGPIGCLSKPLPAKEIIFRKNEPYYDYDWHVAPREQFIVLLDGAIEIEVSDGSKRDLRPERFFTFQIPKVKAIARAT